MMRERIPIAELRRMDEALAACARGEGALVVALAEALALFEERRWFEIKGCSNMESYVRQWVHRSGSWGKEQILLARRLRELPRLRRAIRRSEVRISLAQRLARVAEPEDEEMWLELARGLRVQQVDALLRVDADAGERVGGADDEEPSRPIVRECSPIDQMRFVSACMRLEHLEGRRLPGTTLAMAFCAEIEVFMLGKAPLGPGFDEEKYRRVALARAANRAARRAAEERAAPALPRSTAVDPPEVTLPDDFRGLDRFIRLVAAQLARLDVEIGRRAESIFRHPGWKRLGYASPEQYAEERVGVSLRTLRSRRRLARSCAKMPPLDRALSGGHIGISVANLVARGAAGDPSRAQEWVDRAQERTVKHLHDEVEAGLLFETGGPPRSEEIDALIAMRRAVAGYVGPRPIRKISVWREGLRGRIYLPATVSWHDKWCQLEQQYAAWGSPHGSFIELAARVVWAAWPIDREEEREYLDVIQREHGQCASPVCLNHDVQPHHVDEKHSGGSDERRNVVGICGRCHLVLIRCGLLQVSGCAPDELTWEMGPRDVGLVVEGRRVARGR